MTKLVAAVRDSEDTAIHRQLIDAALAGNLAAARFCAARIDAAAPDEPPPLPALPITRAEALDPYLLHARLMQAVIEGRLAAAAAREIVDLFGAKEGLARYKPWHLDDTQRAALATPPAPDEAPPPATGTGEDTRDDAGDEAPSRAPCGRDPEQPALAEEAADEAVPSSDRVPEAAPAEGAAEAPAVAPPPPSPASAEGDGAAPAAVPPPAESKYQFRWRPLPVPPEWYL